MFRSGVLVRRRFFAPPSFLRRRTTAAMTATLPISGMAKARLRGVVFDMDGTLTVPVIDFAAMHRAVLGDELYASLRSQSRTGGIDILHHIEAWQPPERRRAYEVIADFERQALERLQIMPGAVELCDYLDSNRVRRGLITRNVKAAVDLFHQRFGLTFSPALGREFRPFKPDPAPLLHICSTWGVSPSEVIMVGDSLKDDVVCGKRAGAYTCLLDETGKYGPCDSFPEDLKPDFKRQGGWTVAAGGLAKKGMWETTCCHCPEKQVERDNLVPYAFVTLKLEVKVEPVYDGGGGRFLRSTCPSNSLRSDKPCFARSPAALLLTSRVIRERREFEGDLGPADAVAEVNLVASEAGDIGPISKDWLIKDACFDYLSGRRQLSKRPLDRSH